VDADGTGGYVADTWQASGGRYGPAMAWEQPYRDPQRQHGFELIGEMVRARRHRLGWSQRYLEMLSGIDQTVISRIENGKQYGLRWLRFADLVDSLGGLDGVSGPPERLARAPFGVRDRNFIPAPLPPIEAIELTDDLYGWEERHQGGAEDSDDDDEWDEDE
jgi:transcriptional regulator with XRE-family HTH domain